MDFRLDKTAEGEDAPAGAIHQLASLLASSLQLGDAGLAPDKSPHTSYLGNMIAEARALHYIEKHHGEAPGVFPETQVDKRYKGLLLHKNSSDAGAGLDKTALAPLAALPWLWAPLMAYFSYTGAKDALASGSAAISDLRKGKIDEAAGDLGWAAFDAATTLPMAGMGLRMLGKGLKGAAVSGKAGRAIAEGGAISGAASAGTRKSLEHMAKSPQVKKWLAGKGGDIGWWDWAQKGLTGLVGGSEAASGAAWRVGRHLDENLLIRAADIPNKGGFMLPYMGAAFGLPWVMGERGYEKREREYEEERESSDEKRKRKLVEQMSLSLSAPDQA